MYLSKLNCGNEWPMYCGALSFQQIKFAPNNYNILLTDVSTHEANI